MSTLGCLHQFGKLRYGCGVCDSFAEVDAATSTNPRVPVHRSDKVDFAGNSLNQIADPPCSSVQALVVAPIKNVNPVPVIGFDAPI